MAIEAEFEPAPLDEPISITELVNRHRRGDEDAVRELFAYHAERLSPRNIA